MKVGVTGHQELENRAWVQDEIFRVLRSQVLPLVGITSLAIGADQLFARAVLDCGGSLKIILPTKYYFRSFDADGLREYERLLAQASSVEILSEATTEEEGYLAAGKRVVELCDTLIAVWNGKPAAGLGGTADVVSYAKRQGRHCIHLNPDTKKVNLF